MADRVEDLAAETFLTAWRRPAPRLVVAAAALAIIAVGLVPFLRDSPDVVARAAAERRTGRPDDTVDSVVESWQGDGRARSVVDGGRQEIALDTTTGLGEEYLKLTSPQLEEILPVRAHDASGLGAPALPSGVVGDLAVLLDRARAGEQDLHLVGETTVRGVPAYELRLDFSVAHLRMSRLIYVSRADYLPLRVVERGPRGEVFTVTDYRDIERLPIDGQTEAQLRMSPHPGVQRLAG